MLDEALGRLFRLSPRALTDAELLCIVLDEPDAGALLSGTSLKLLAQRSPDEWLEDPHHDASSAAKVLAAIELGRRSVLAPAPRQRLRTPQAIADFMRPRLANLRREELHVLCLSTSSHLLRHARVAEGSATECHVDPREVFAPAIACRAAAVVLVHNHPSGDPQPSASDLALTRQLAEAGRTLCIRLVDHLVLADGGGFVSIASHALPTLPAP
jgi:DNA repair protein RadC